jgi:adenylosuccinate synthase
MMINQIVERARGGARHGSCGLGVGETVERSQNADLAVSAADLADRPRLAAALKRARAEWVFPRLAALGMAALDDEDRARLADPAIDARWLDDAERFAARTRLAEAPAPGRLIFEGAQGLRLDQTRGDFPYVTRSNTGCRNVVALARDWGVEALERIYVSRIYLTRHGAGPLPREASSPLFPGLADATNVPNPWQGALRFAPLDLDRLAADIAADGADADGFESRPSLAVTCLDQPPGRVEVYRDRTAMWETPEGVVALAAASVAPRRVMTSRGPTRTTFAQSSRNGGRGAALEADPSEPWRGRTTRKVE